MDPLGLRVQKCCAPAQIAKGLVDHCWIKTDSFEAGVGNYGGGVPGNDCDWPYIAETQVVSHAGSSESRDGTTCQDVPDVDEKCVDEQIRVDPLGLGQETGRFTLTNNCQTFVNGVLIRCRKKCEPKPRPCAGFGCPASSGW